MTCPRGHVQSFPSDWQETPADVEQQVVALRQRLFTFGARRLIREFDLPLCQEDGDCSPAQKVENRNSTGQVKHRAIVAASLINRYRIKWWPCYATRKPLPAPFWGARSP